MMYLQLYLLHPGHVYLASDLHMQHSRAALLGVTSLCSSRTLSCRSSSAELDADEDEDESSESVSVPLHLSLALGSDASIAVFDIDYAQEVRDVFLHRVLKYSNFS